MPTTPDLPTLSARLARMSARSRELIAISDRVGAEAERVHQQTMALLARMATRLDPAQNAQ